VWDQHCKLQLTSDQVLQDWFAGIVGSQLIWDDNAFADQQKWKENDEIGVSHTDASLGKRKSGAPRLLYNYQELQDFVD